MGVPWLQALHWPPNVELALSHKAPSAGSTEAGDLTQAIVSTPFVPDAKECESLSSVTQQLGEKRGSPPGAAPLYYKGDLSFPSLCLDRVPVDLPIVVDVKQAQLNDPQVLAIDVVSHLSRGVQANWIELLVDGIMLLHRSIPANVTEATDRIAISDGTHLIAVRAGTGTTVLLQGSKEFSLPNANRIGVRASSRALHSHFQDPAANGAPTSKLSTSVVFTIGNSNHQVFYYQLRNNGVVIRRGAAPSSQHRLELVRTVPLNLGTNNIIIEVSDGQGRFAESEVTVTRRPSQPVSAVLVGTDSPYASEDAELMRRTLLRFTDASVNDISVLAGRGATRAAIEQAILNNSVSRPVDPFTAGIYSPETFLFYYAGYGLTIDDKTRCVLPADFVPQRARDTCLSTSQFDAWLDAHDRSVVVFDTSYDGRTGVGPGGPAIHVGQTRTYRDYVSDDSNWRVSAGVDRSDRLFLVASETNSPALTSDEFRHGLFTVSLSDAIAEQAGEMKDNPNRQASIYEAFALARNKTLDRSAGQQRPIVKGVLSAPFAFSERPRSQLKEEANGIVERTAHDALAMRALNTIELVRARSLYEKVLFFDPSDADAMLGLATVNLYQGNLPAAADLIETSLRESKGDEGTRSRWLLLRSKVKTRGGDIAGARDDADEAYREQPRSTEIRIELAYLRAASGDYKGCRELLEELGRELLNKGIRAESDEAEDARIADDSWGRAVLLLYVAFQRTGHSHSASLLLRSYSEAYQDKFRLKRLVHSRLFQALSARHSHAIAIGSQNVEEPWSHLVAEYFQHPTKYADDLSSFRNRTQTLDLKDESAFNCLLHYYRGMRALLEGNRNEARAEFEAVSETSRRDYIEYWVVQSELRSLNASAAATSEQRRSQ
jgi:hypothetical protein